MSHSKTKVHDLVIRIFHWVFATSFIIAFFISNVIDDDSPLYVYHMLLGFLMVFLLVLRVLLGLFGSKYARFSSFKLKPSELLEYFSSLFSSKTKRYLGHNPASSYAVIAMFIFTLGLGMTGILMGLDFYEHFFEEVHELCANAFLMTVIAHIVGVVFHQFKHNDDIVLSMLNGKKYSVEGETGIQSNRPMLAFVFVGFLILFTFYLNKSFDSRTQTLNVFGTSIQLGEDEHGEKNNHKRRKYDDDHDDDD